jgi:hypothetical protein
MVNISDDSEELTHVGVSETSVISAISARYEIQKTQVNKLKIS